MWLTCNYKGWRIFSEGIAFKIEMKSNVEISTMNSEIRVTEVGGNGWSNGGKHVGELLQTNIVM